MKIIAHGPCRLGIEGNELVNSQQEIRLRKALVQAIAGKLDALIAI